MEQEYNDSLTLLCFLQELSRRTESPLGLIVIHASYNWNPSAWRFDYQAEILTILECSLTTCQDLGFYGILAKVFAFNIYKKFKNIVLVGNPRSSHWEAERKFSFVFVQDLIRFQVKCHQHSKLDCDFS